jgi:hypothetical protein
MKKIFIPILFLLTVSLAYAQNEDVAAASQGDGSDYQPTAGQITASINFGQASYLTNPVSYLPSNFSWTIGGGAPSASMMNTSSNPITNMAGVEVRYFLNEKMAIRATGGGLLRNVPYRVDVEGFQDPDAPISTWTPAYTATAAYNQFDANLNLGFEYHLKTDYDRLRPYGAIVVPFAYGRASAYDMTVNVPNTNSTTSVASVEYNSSSGSYDISFTVPTTFDPSATDPDNAGFTVQTYEADLGPRHVQSFAWGAQVVAGLDYYIKDGFYIGVEIRPISWMYAATLQYRTPGYPPRISDSQTWGFFTQPYFKLGFRVFKM